MLHSNSSFSYPGVSVHRVRNSLKSLGYRGYADNVGKKSVLGRAAGALGSLAKGYLLTGAVASLGMLAATAYSSSSPSHV